MLEQLKRKHGVDTLGLSLGANDTRSLVEAFETVCGTLGSISGFASMAGPLISGLDDRLGVPQLRDLVRSEPE